MIKNLLIINRIPMLFIRLWYKFVNDKMMKTKAEGKTIGLDRIAVISALNFANDSLRHKDITNKLNSTIKQKILDLNEKIDSLLQN